MSLSVWMHFFDQIAPATRERVTHALEQAGIGIGAMSNRPTGFGLAVFETVGAATLAQLRALSGQATVLAISTAPAAPPASDMWAMLAAGAADVLSWPQAVFNPEQVAARLARWDAVQRLVASDAVQSALVGTSAAWRTLVRGIVEVAAFTESAVLITGETGTGKDLIARLIARLGGGNGELTVLDCTTLSPELAGSELFGHERGAFTGAAAPRDGAFALADGGVLFLDEVGELPLPLQGQLLRAIQEQHYKRVGSNAWQSTRFRLVCATNRELEEEVAKGRFRADLFYRIAGWRCRTPPLRERVDDILPLASHFLAQLAPRGSAAFALDPAVREYLLTRAYPGNVRDLRQTVARIWHRHSGPGPITIGDVPPDERQGGGQAPLWPDRRFENAIRHAIELGVGLSRISQMAADIAIQLVLEQEGDNNQRAAARLGVTDRALQIRRKAWASGTPNAD